MNEWARLVDRYAGELKKYELVCAFCGQHLADGNVNLECPENSIGLGTKGAPAKGAYGSTTRAEVKKDTVKYFTEDAPMQECCGNKRHWFGKPSLKGYK